MTSAIQLECHKLSSGFTQLVKSKLIRFQIRHAQFGTVGVREVDLKETVVSDEDDVVVCCRIEFVGGVLWDSGISSGMESGQGRS